MMERMAQTSNKVMKDSFIQNNVQFKNIRDYVKIGEKIGEMS